MATTFKNFLNNDTTNTKTLLHESIPVTGSIVSGTYYEGGAGGITETNIKNYAHGMFQSVYDYPYLSSSANHILDVTVGISASSGLSGGAGETVHGPIVQQQKKINIYNQLAQVLMGHTIDGNINGFDRDGDLTGISAGLTEVFIVSFARLLGKDEIKKGSFTMDIYNSGAVGTASISAQPSASYTIGDYGAATSYKVNSPAGEYGILYADSTPTGSVGLLFYQANIAVLSSSIFSLNPVNSFGHATDALTGGAALGPEMTDIYAANATFGVPYYIQRNYFGNAKTSSASVQEAFMSQSISGAADGFRNRVKNISFNNTTELNSTIYFCRANHNEFNYSSNPTYVDASKIVVKNNTTDLPVSYITTIGLYSADNELLAMAKISEPLKKDPNTELTLRVRLDY